MSVNLGASISEVEARKVQTILLKLFKGIGWFFLLYIIVVACVHVVGLPELAYRFYNGLWGSYLDVGMENIIALMANHALYLLLSLSGAIIFLCKKKRLSQTEKPVKLRKLSLLTAIFLAMPFSYFFLDAIIGFCQPINIFYHLSRFISKSIFYAFPSMEPANLLELYISRMDFYWSDRSSYAYMATIFCTYYVIKQIYLYVYQARKTEKLEK